MPATTVSVPGTVTFKRVISMDLSGSCLWFELPGMTCEKMRKLFGTGMASQKKEKYSSRIYIESSVTGRRYSLYMCFGEWRVGAFPNSPEIDEAALRKLLN